MNAIENIFYTYIFLKILSLTRENFKRYNAERLKSKILIETFSHTQMLLNADSAKSLQDCAFAV